MTTKTERPARATKGTKKSTRRTRTAAPPVLPGGSGPGAAPPAGMFLNREWSWLAFNERVLDEAACVDNPLLERMKFLAIVSSNLDEFYMVRVAGLKRQIEAGDLSMAGDELKPSDVMTGVAERVAAMVGRQQRMLYEELLPALAEQNIRLVHPRSAAAAEAAFLEDQFVRSIEPVLTPIAVDPTHPFPTLLNCRLYLLVVLQGRPGRALPAAPLAFVEVPQNLPRFIRLPGGGKHECRVCALEDVITHHLDRVFAGYVVQAVYPLRITRDADLEVDADERADLLTVLQDELASRSRGSAVRLQYAATCPPELVELLLGALGVPAGHAFALGERFQLQDAHQLVATVDRPDLKDEPLQPLLPTTVVQSEDIFEVIRGGDVFLYHPYHSFDTTVELVSQAADDDGVMAIKQTLYRTSGDSPIVKALARAAEKGKQVTALVELRARFDEERNIQWAQRLEQAGVHVIYGLLGLKTHCKALLVVRRETGGIRRYLHLSTGNYNDRTARLYTDMALMTCDEDLAMDGAALFNVITGYSEPPEWRKLEMAPTGLRDRILMLIEREIQKSTPRKRGSIVAKMNSLVDRAVIEALYRASRAGVKVDLIIRGICCLRPGVAGLSDNVRVISVVGRFLEHARVFYFRNGGHDELYLSSADWMPRNFDTRIETLFPLESPDIKKLVMAIIEMQLADTVKARELLPDGTYRMVTGKKRVDSQQAVADMLRSEKRKAGRERRRAERAARTGPFVPLSSPDERRKGGR